MDVLSNYLLHRLRGDPLETPVQSTDGKQTFIPSGWDSPGLIEFQGNKEGGAAADVNGTDFNSVVPVPSGAAGAGNESKSGSGGVLAVAGGTGGGAGDSSGVTAHDDASFL